MFFRRQTVKKLTFSDYLTQIRAARFETASEPDGGTRVSRDGIAAVIADGPKVTSRAGVLFGSAIGTLVDGGYQKFLQTPDGKRRPAQAAQLKAIHEFQEDLREALGLTSLYNESLGTVSNQYIYDRVEERDLNQPKDAWKIATPAKLKA